MKKTQLWPWHKVCERLKVYASVVILKFSRFKRHQKLHDVLLHSLRGCKQVPRFYEQESNYVVYLYFNVLHEDLDVGKTIRSIDARTREHVAGVHAFNQGGKIPAYVRMKSLGMASCCMCPLICVGDSGNFEINIWEKYSINEIRPSLNMPFVELLRTFGIWSVQ